MRGPARLAPLGMRSVGAVLFSHCSHREFRLEIPVLPLPTRLDLPATPLRQHVVVRPTVVLSLLDQSLVGGLKNIDERLIQHNSDGVSPFYGRCAARRGIVVIN